MRYFLIGTLLSIIAIFVSVIIWDIHMVHVLTGAISLIFIATAMLLSGTFISGDRMRANQASEADEDRDNRTKVVNRSLIMAMPNLVIALLFYFLL